MLPSLLFSILTLFSRGWGGGLIERGGWLLQKLAAKVALIREGGLDRAFMENSLLKQYMGNREWMGEGGVMLFSVTNWGWVSRFYAHERVESSVLRWTFTFPHAFASGASENQEINQGQVYQFEIHLLDAKISLVCINV